MTSTGLSALFHVRNIGVGKEAVVSYAVLGQTQAEYLKIDLFFSPLFVLLLSGASQMGFYFARKRCVEVNDALAAYIILLRH